MKKICQNCEYYNIVSKNTVSEWGVCSNCIRDLYKHDRFINSTDVCALFSGKLPDNPDDNLKANENKDEIVIDVSNKKEPTHNEFLNNLIKIDTKYEKAKDILDKTYEKHEHRMAEYPCHDTKNMVLDAIKTALDTSKNIIDYNEYLEDWQRTENKIIDLVKEFKRRNEIDCDFYVTIPKHLIV